MTYYLKVLLQKFQAMKSTLLSLHPKLTAIYKIFIRSTSQIIVLNSYAQDHLINNTDCHLLKEPPLVIDLRLNVILRLKRFS